MSAALEELEARLGYRFRDRRLLCRALTHKSSLGDHTRPAAAKADDNEQLEFLGDAVLGFLVSEALIERHPSFPEGALSKLRAFFVSASHLSEVARRLNLGHYLVLGRGEEMSGGRTKKTLLGDALEAIIAALYMDGGSDTARQFVIREVVGDFAPVESDRDFKSILQETARALSLPQPSYLTLKESGPEHCKTFTVEARVGANWSGKAEGPSKKAAGQQAARVLLQQLMDAID